MNSRLRLTSIIHKQLEQISRDGRRTNTVSHEKKERKQTTQGRDGCHWPQFGHKIHFFFGKGVGEILWGAANVLQNKLTRAQYLDEVTWTTKSWVGLQKQRISVVLHTAIAEQIVNELASGEGGRVHGAKCLAVLAGVA